MNLHLEILIVFESIVLLCSGMASKKKKKIKKKKINCISETKYSRGPIVYNSDGDLY